MSRYHNAGIRGHNGSARRRQWLAATTRTCAFCGRDGADTVDHIIPLALGGQDNPLNWQPAHRQCNSRAGGTLGNQLRRPFATSRAW